MLKKHSTSSVVAALGCSGGRPCSMFVILLSSLLSISVVIAIRVSRNVYRATWICGHQGGKKTMFTGLPGFAGHQGGKLNKMFTGPPGFAGHQGGKKTRCLQGHLGLQVTRVAKKQDVYRATWICGHQGGQKNKCLQGHLGLHVTRVTKKKQCLQGSLDLWSPGWHKS